MRTVAVLHLVYMRREYIISIHKFYLRRVGKRPAAVYYRTADGHYRPVDAWQMELVWDAVSLLAAGRNCEEYEWKYEEAEHRTYNLVSADKVEPWIVFMAGEALK